MAEFNFIDGTAIGSTQVGSDYIIDEFGETKNGVWIPKAYSGSYGTNGFRFTFDSTHLNTSGSAITDPNGSSTDLPKQFFSDASGSGNHFEKSTNLASTDIVIDTPTNNFSTWNSLFRGGEKSSSIYSSSTLSEGNLKVSVPTNSYMGNTFRPTSGKWYMEIRVTTVGSSNLEIDWGWIQATEYSGNTGHGAQANKWGVFAYQTHIRLYDETSQLGSNISVTVSAGDILQLAWDIDNNKGWVGINNTWYRTNASDGNPSAGTNETFTFTDDEAQNLQCYIANGTSTDVHVANFGQDDTFAGAISSSGNTDSSGAKFKYAPPTDFLALCSKNITDTTISPNQQSQATDFFDTQTWSGDANSTRNITLYDFNPDWVWIKNRTGGNIHILEDTSRGVTSSINTALSTSSSDKEGFGSSNTSSTVYGAVSDFIDNGFTLKHGSTDGRYVNKTSNNYVGWSWKAGGSAPTKTYKVKVVADSTDYGHGTGSNKYQFLKVMEQLDLAQMELTLICKRVELIFLIGVIVLLKVIH